MAWIYLVASEEYPKGSKNGCGLYLIDILDQIVDGVMAGLARSGTYRQEPISEDLLMKAYRNTVDLLVSHVEVDV